MKTLQNNFTTPEQSKRLLELGVPEWTADCLIKNNAEKDKPTIRVKEPCTGYYFANDEYISCWSVGRLMEIFLICNTYELSGGSQRDWYTTIATLLQDFDVAAEEHKLDFSKLDEYLK